MKAEAKKHIEEKFFDGYPQHESDYIGDRRLKDIADLMEEYANHKALILIEKAVEQEAHVPYGHDPEMTCQKAVCNRILRSVRRKLK